MVVVVAGHGNNKRSGSLGRHNFPPQYLLHIYYSKVISHFKSRSPAIISIVIMDRVHTNHADGDEGSHDSIIDKPLDGRIELDLKGDLSLDVGQYQILVSSRVLELSCPFFRRML